MCAALFGLMAVCSTIVFSGRARRRRQRAGEAEPGQEKGRPIEKHVEVAVGRGVDTGHAGNRPECARQFLRDRARRLAQAARQIEGDRRSEIAERAVGRVFDRNREVGVGQCRAAGLARRAHAP